MKHLFTAKLVTMRIKELKKELGLKDKDIAEFFGLKHRSYSESSAKQRYEQAFINIHDFLKASGEKKTIKLLPLNLIKCTCLRLYITKKYMRSVAIRSTGV